MKREVAIKGSTETSVDLILESGNFWVEASRVSTIQTSKDEVITVTRCFDLFERVLYSRAIFVSENFM